MAEASEPKLRTSKNRPRANAMMKSFLCKESFSIEDGTKGEGDVKSIRSSITLQKQQFHIVDHETKEQLRLKNIKGEVISTEITYLEQLNNLIVVRMFFSPYRGSHTNHYLLQKFYMEPMINCGLLSENSSVCRQIFGNVRSLEKLHRKLLYGIKDILVREGLQDGLIADQFLAFEPYFKLYNEYVMHFDVGFIAIRSLLSDPTAAQLFEKHCGCGPTRGNTLELQSLRIGPVQRLPRYLMLFTDIVKYTPPDSPDLQKFCHIRDLVNAQILELETLRIGQDASRKLAVVNQLLPKESKQKLALSTELFIHKFEYELHTPAFCDVCSRIMLKKRMYCKVCSSSVHVRCMGNVKYPCKVQQSLLTASRRFVKSAENVFFSVEGSEPQSCTLLLFSDSLILIAAFETTAPIICVMIRWFSKSMDTSFSIICEEDGTLVVTNPRDSTKNYIRFSVPPTLPIAQEWKQIIYDTSSLWFGIQKEAPQVKNGRDASIGHSSIDKFTLGLDLFLDDVEITFSVSTALPVKIEAGIDLVFTIHVMHPKGNDVTLYKRPVHIAVLHEMIILCKYPPSEIPELPKNTVLKTFPSQHYIQKRIDRFEAYLNKILLLSPPVFHFIGIRQFFFGQQLSGDDEMEFSDNLFMRSSLSE